jgi:hypothetical protein
MAEMAIGMRPMWRFGGDCLARLLPLLAQGEAMTSQPFHPNNVVEMRCPDCRRLKVECPRGYVAEIRQCDVCGYRFALSAPGCAPECRCPREGCVGSTSVEQDDGA